MSTPTLSAGGCHHQVLALGGPNPKSERGWTELLSATRILATHTASEGTSFVPLAENEPATLVVIPNLTPTTLEVLQGDEAHFVPPGAVHAFSGLHNARELLLRRADREDDPVTLLWAAEPLAAAN